MTNSQALKLPSGTEPPRVLVVDDVDANRALLVRLLIPAGFSAREAGDGREAVEVAQTWLPHVVLMDVQMPELDGISATRKIKTASWGQSICVIIVSGATDEMTVADALAAGALTFIAKPFLDAEILAALGSALALTYVEPS